MKRVALVSVLVVAALVAAAAGTRAFMVWNRTRDRLPEFTDVAAGAARAPAGSNVMFGLRVGEARRADVDAWLAARGFGAEQCRDTSMRALMQAKRESIKSEMAAAEARGDDPDGVTGASLANYRSKKESNPQVRISCEPVVLEGKGSESGRLLLLFDSAEHPLRHASFARKVGDAAEAYARWSAAVDAMTQRFGEPTAAVGDEPDVRGAEPFPRMKIYKREWKFADLRAEVSAMSFGARGIDVREVLEVPWPVRADAPGVTRR